MHWGGYLKVTFFLKFVFVYQETQKESQCIQVTKEVQVSKEEAVEVPFPQKVSTVQSERPCSQTCSEPGQGASSGHGKKKRICIGTSFCSV